MVASEGDASPFSIREIIDTETFAAAANSCSDLRRLTRSLCTVVPNDRSNKDGWAFMSFPLFSVSLGYVKTLRANADTLRAFMPPRGEFPLAGVIADRITLG